MIVGILGAGKIGSTIAGRLSAGGHEVLLANSRNPETIRDVAVAAGARAVYAADAARGADVVITSVPFARVPSLRAAISVAPAEAVIIDTSNYFPFRDGTITAVENGQVESEWVAEQLGRPVVKAWNNILAGSFATKGAESGTRGRIALAVAGDDTRSKSVAMQFVDLTGFDAVDAGTINQSWRQQPGTPAYCTDLSAHELERALASADREASASKREEMVARMKAIEGTPSNDDLLRLSRAVYL
ncbi:NADPH-dependent F420 reductase [Rhodococcus sp. MSC1_016]|uniref:NADPH-dependent F420 reductase n=1 Tax=Rhodococcus sp. MSC1_016 TaxID=2909266 RepID=UPI00202DE646|nr:NAD(P)-binding domain-containing protein [Rhodococcus sp. MSC1_016]